MKFVYPEFLFALSAIAIPIIIHLFNFRKFKKVYFSNVEFLKEVQQETQAKSKLKHLLILLSRIVAISFLVLAFAQPFVPTSADSVANQNNVVGVYIDNSFSMESVGENGNLLNEAKNKAIEVVNAYRSTDKFVLTTNSFKAGDQRLLSAEETIDKIEAVTISSKTRNLSTVYSRMRDAINASEIKNKSFYTISDFQKTTSDFQSIKADSTITSYLISVISNESNNLYIDSCWFSSPTHLINQNEELSVRIKNNSNNDLENIPLKLFINQQNVVPATFSVKANDEVVLKLNYLNKSFGTQQGKIELRDDAVTTDDTFYFTYEISKNIDVLVINGETEAQALQSIFSTDSIFNFKLFNTNQLDYSLIKKSNLVVLHHLKEVNSGLANSLKAFIDKGGSLYVIPSDEIDFNSYKEFLSLVSVNYFTNLDTVDTKVRDLNYEHPIYQNVFETKPKGNLNLPIVSSHYNISKSTVSYKSNILTLKNGNPFIIEYKVGRGIVYLSTTSLSKESSSFTSHAIFVPTLYNMSLLSQKTYPLFHVIGRNSTIEVNRNEKDDVYHIKNKTIDIIPQTRNNNNYLTVFVSNNIENAGNYSLENNLTKIGLAFNYNRQESDLSTYNSEEIEEIIHSSNFNAKVVSTTNTSVESALNELNIGKKYWKYCIILALLFLAAEIALIKLLK